MRRGIKVLLFLFLLLGVWLPRGLALEQFATPDEAAWVGRSAAFYHALVHRDFQQTFQHGHPGVTLTWAGTLAYRWRYPAMAWEADQNVLKNWKNVEPFLREHGVKPLIILKASRTFMVLGITATLAVAFLYALRLSGFWLALFGFGLIAFDPFFVGLTRLLHLDGMVSSLMLLSLLAFLSFTFRGRHIFDLLVAGVAAGLSWLTRSPALFLGLFFGLLALGEAIVSWRSRGQFQLPELWGAYWPVFLWTGIGVITFFLLWPAMWVNPVSVVGEMFERAFSYAAEGHSSVIFFNGQVVKGDAGWLFYPITYLWRTTPVVLFGLGFVVVGLAFKRGYFRQVEIRRISFILLLFATLFGVAMSLGAKKFDRYLLPSYLPLDLLAGMGWYAVASWVWGRREGLWGGIVGVGIVALVGLSQIILTVQTYPYYLSYYNPLLGGSKKAPEVMMIGWGEGLDQVARYLNTLPEAGNLRVMSHYSEGSVSYFFEGTTLNLINHWEGIDSDELAGVDYLVVYIHQWQRQKPDPALLDFFASQTPVYVVHINGLNYAQVYSLHVPPD